MTPEELADEAAMEAAVETMHYGNKNDMRPSYIRQRTAFREGWRAAKEAQTKEEPKP